MDTTDRGFQIDCRLKLRYPAQPSPAQPSPGHQCGGMPASYTANNLIMHCQPLLLAGTYQSDIQHAGAGMLLMLCSHAWDKLTLQVRDATHALSQNK